MEDCKDFVDIEKEEENKLLLLGILIFTIGTFTLDTFISSLILEGVFLILTIIVFLTYYIFQNKSFIIYKLELMWLVFFMYFIFNFLYQSNFAKGYFVDVVVFFLLFTFLLLVKLRINYYKIAMNTMLIISIIYAFSVLFQYFNMDLYTRIILPLFTSVEQEIILQLYKSGKGTYTGFTWQTGYVAGYLVYGIGILLLLFKERTNKLSRVLSRFALPLLFIALLLTGKRAHLLFMLLALAITYLFSTGIKRFFSQSLKLIILTITIIGAVMTLFTIYTPNKDTPIIGNIFEKVKNTVRGLIDGDDITSGRTLLYDYAFKLFNETPIFGIGWREFSQLSAWVFNNERGSHPHNIYFQLLTELGLVGFMLFMIPIVYTLFKTIKLLMNAESLFSFDMRWKTGLQFSLFSQIFFLLYGMTGNLLTDHIFILMWLFAASITLSSIKYSKRKTRLNKLSYSTYQWKGDPK